MLPGESRGAQPGDSSGVSLGDAGRGLPADSFGELDAAPRTGSGGNLPTGAGHPLPAARNSALRTELRIVAEAGRVAHIDARGGLTARHTGAERVHLIGAAATPLGGDHIAVTVIVGPGARLTLRGVAATLALPGRGTVESSAHWHVDIAEGGELDMDTPAMIVAGGAGHSNLTSVRLAPGARLRLREQVQIGRTGERHGRWRGDLTADLGAMPLIRHRLELGAGVATDDMLTAPRSLISELRYPDDRPAETFGLTAARLPLEAGGSLYTGFGDRLSDTPAPR